jgi:hypothetical protein
MHQLSVREKHIEQRDGGQAKRILVSHERPIVPKPAVAEFEYS